MTAAVNFHLGFPAPRTAVDAHLEQDLRRALEAYHFFYPTVSMEAIFHGNRAAGAADNAVALLVMAHPRHTGFTYNSDTPYAFAVLDLADAGPMVVEIPPGPLVGMIDDHHHHWITDLGLTGEDAGHGGKHLILPPGWDRPPPDGYHAAKADTRKVMLGLRVLPVGGDVDAAKRLIATVRVYPLGSSDTDKFTFSDITARSLDSTPLAWEDNLEFWRVLHRVIDAEQPVERMRPMFGMLAELGIEPGKPFDPDATAARLLTQAARQGRDEMLVSAFASRRPDRIVWPDRGWEWVGLRPDSADFEHNGLLDFEARDRWFAQAIGTSPAIVRRAAGQGSVYWLACRDAEGDYLDGGRTYRLTVPLPVPASLFWSVTCYDSQTRSEVVADQGQAALRSLFEDLSPAGAGEVDLWFGPRQPPGTEGRWLQTVPGRGWFCYFRIYGPEQPAFDGSWKPGDITATG